MKTGEKISFCGGRYWCPIAQCMINTVMIRDDNGGTVSFGKEQWRELVRKAKNGELDLE